MQPGGLEESKETLATRRSCARNGLAPTPLPAARGAGPSRSGFLPRAQQRSLREQQGPIPGPASRSRRRKAFAARVSLRGWQWPPGTAQSGRTSVSQDRGGPHPTSHFTRPYWRGLRSRRRGASRPSAGHAAVTRGRGSAVAPAFRGALGAGWREAARRCCLEGAGLREWWGRSRLGPKWVSDRSRVSPEWAVG